MKLFPCLLALLAGSFIANSQELVPVPGQRILYGPMAEDRLMVVSPEYPSVATSQMVFGYASAEVGGRVVKGAPYSAEAVTEVTHTLADGNRIYRKTTAAVYRDSEGRTRREQTLSAIGPLPVQANGSLETVFINDPVAGAHYVLRPANRLAHKSPGIRVDVSASAVGDGTSGLPSGAVIMQRTTDPNNKEAKKIMLRKQTVIRAELEREPTVAGRMREQGLIKTESLGKRVIEGVEAEGSITTMTIPAGQIGNERPIEVVMERWFSPELQALVYSRRNDPQSGETVYSLKNINRAEPSALLFQIPPDYTIQEMPASRGTFIQRLPPPPSQN